MAAGLLAFLALLVGSACGTVSPRHVVIVTLDTLRADRLGAYGYLRPTSPHFDELAKRGVLFAEAISPAIATPPSHASIFTGLYPPNHGLRRVASQSLAPSNETLAELLEEHGFATAAFVGAVPLLESSGLGQGFDVYEDSFDGRPERTAEETNALVAEWLEERPKGRLLLWVHYFDPHGPYLAPAAEQQRFAGGSFERNELPKGVNANIPGTRPMSAPMVRTKRDLYDAEVSYTDAALGELVDLLEAAGILENAVLAVVADHGECLGKRNYYFGHWDVYPATARVPMLLLRPDGRYAGTVVDATVSLVDLMPTLLRWVGIPVPDGLDGRDLTPLIDRRETGPRTAYTEQFDSHKSAVYRGRWMLRESRSDSPRNRQPLALFDRREDPALATDVREEEPELTARLVKALASREGAASGPSAPTRELSDEVREQLRHMGYVE